ncbi:unnamed protein product [Paramecium sonneborni]|uniref:RING-type domain-containing protein n=1 Tax=Paramecium sonneborni TaxID=65129 RepID=A0A8S1P7S6_9CILI|nr:unnamed protein product [Paramecium sonneborni]
MDIFQEDGLDLLFDENIFFYGFQDFEIESDLQNSSEMMQNVLDFEIESDLQNSSEMMQNEFIDVVRVQNFEEMKVFIDELICPICSHLFVDPRICQECSQGFCKQCLLKWFQGNKKSCPCCRSLSNQKSDGTQPPKILLKLLSKLKISCKYQDNGCKEVISYDNREIHFESKCEYKLINCKYCLCKILQRDSQTHLSECEQRPIKCMWCSKIFSYFDHLNHSDKCPSRIFKCTQCLKNIPYSKINIHTQNYCQNKQIKKQKKEYLESKLEIEKVKAELLRKMKKIKKLERLIKRQKQMNQEYLNEQNLNNDSINSNVDILQLETQNWLDENQFVNQQGLQLVNQNEDYQDNSDSRLHQQKNQLKKKQVVDKDENKIITNQEQKLSDY